MDMKKTDLLLRQRETESTLAVCIALQQLGIISGEMTYAHALQIYGAWFRDAVASGRLAPVRYGGGNGRTRYFSVPKILSLKSLEYETLNDSI